MVDQPSLNDVPEPDKASLQRQIDALRAKQTEISLDTARRVRAAVAEEYMHPRQQEWRAAGLDRAIGTLTLSAERQLAGMLSRATIALIAHDREVSKERERVTHLINELSEYARDAAQGLNVDGYARSAKESRTRAWRWTIGALIAATLAISAGIYQLLEDAEKLTTTQSITRAAITVSLLIVAGFLSRIAAEERRDARNANHMQLQLATSRAYLERLEEPEKSQAQLALTLQFFPGQSQDPHGSGAGVASDNLAQILASLKPDGPAGK